MVRYLGPRSVANAVIQHRPEVVIANGRFDALLIGSGISKETTLWQRRTMHRLVRSRVPKVLDAGALYLVRNLEDSENTLITPHYGELAYLMGFSPIAIEADPIKFAVESAILLRTNVLLKGYMTILTDGHRVIELPAATSWLATAGTGDVLAGIIGALIAINKEKFNSTQDLTNDAAELSTNLLLEIGATAAFIHSESAKALKGPVISTDLITKIPELINLFSN